MKGTNVQRTEVLLYCAFTCIVNSLSASLVSLLIQWFLKPQKLGGALTYLILSLGSLAVTLALFYRLFAEKISAHYLPQASKGLLPKTALALILPGELLRFLLCVIYLGSTSATGRFSIIPTLLFEGIYLKRAGRYTAVREFGSIIAWDVIAYFGCYVLYFAVYLLAVMAIYRYVWNVRKKERKNFGIQEAK